MTIRRETKQVSLITILVLLCIIWLGSAGISAAESLKQGGTLVIAVDQDLSNTDPLADGGGITAMFMHHIYEPLVAYDNDMSFVPVLAEKWDVSDDMKTYTFYLRKGKLFHSGREMVADDVKYSFELFANPKRCVRAGQIFIDNVEIVDKYTVRVHLKKPDSMLLDILAYIAPVMGILPRAESEAQGKKITHPIGTGPFEFVEWKPDRHYLIKKFKDYVPNGGPVFAGLGGEKTVYLDYVKWVPMSEETVKIMALVNKDIDIAYTFPPKYYGKYESEYKQKGVVVTREIGLVSQMFYFGCNKPVTNNVKFRQACAYAVDMEMVCQASMMGYGVRNPSMVSTISKYWTPDHKYYIKKDVNKAKELLKEAGYKGEEVKIMVSKRSQWQYRAAVAMEPELKAVGINAKLEVVEWPTALANFYKGNYQILSFALAPKPEPIASYNFFGANGFDRQFPRMAEIRAEVAKTMDLNKRKKLYAEAHKLMIDGVGAINGYHLPVMNAYGDQVKGYKAWWTGTCRLWNVWLDEKK